MEAAREVVRLARILVVDDSLLIRKVLRELLTEAGHEVVGEARDGLEAPVRVRELAPDLVMLDLVMPGRSGISTLQHMLMIDPSLAVVVCSASLDERRVLRALQLGAQGFIVKPFGREHVLNAVEEALRRRDRSEPVIDERQLEPVGVPFERLHRVCYDLAGELRAILEAAVDRHKVTLDELLALEYQEFRGPMVRRLNRLFDVGCVDEYGFSPPKFQTAYDAIVDEPMMERMDAVLAAEPRLTFALPFDLNVYAPAHNGAFSRDCTGDPIEDLALNRTKRFFLESAALTRAARMGLGIEPPQRRLSRDEIERAGGHLHEPRGDGPPPFLIAIYLRDTGAVLRTLSVPLYVRGERFGAVTIGWDPLNPPI